ncbi:hypothetical protein [Streptomyces sp. GS7]|uniref:hypothetical protein n=1 Tax=Streptomyces sp. GS7 TaxID=2692234 RepID=UPI001317040E|nr:hypothetical protein [Streptomyces sp. GS7]QHC23964.1 hypothetical protein GR130_23925 [Streptomyces sp. GS7]
MKLRAKLAATAAAALLPTLGLAAPAHADNYTMLQNVATGGCIQGHMLRTGVEFRSAPCDKLDSREFFLVE